MRKKLAGIYSHAPLSQIEIDNLQKNLDRELVIDTDAITSKDILDSSDITKYLMMFRYDRPTDPATSITRYIPTLEFLGNTSLYIAGADWINIEAKTYEFLTSGTTVQHALEELDTGLSEASTLKHIIDLTGNGSVVSSNDGSIPLSTCDDEDYLIVLGNLHGVQYATYATILGGYNSYILGENTEQKLTYGFILSSVYGMVSGTSSYSGLLGGVQNEIINNSINSVCIGGNNNKISGVAENAQIFGGDNNTIHGETNSYISILNSHNSTAIDSTNVSVENSNYIYVNNSAYISVIGSDTVRGDDVYSLVSTGSAHFQIKKSQYISIDSSICYDNLFALYDAYYSSISDSVVCKIWESTYSSIIASASCKINGYADEISHTVSEIGSSYVVLDSIVGITIGQTVTLSATSTDGLDAYLVKLIDSVTKKVTLCSFSGISVDLSKYSATSCGLYAINIYETPIAIVSNTANTITLNSELSISVPIEYVVIDDYAVVNKFSVSFPNTNDKTTITLSNYDGTPATFGINELQDMQLYVYSANYSSNINNIIHGAGGSSVSGSEYSSIISSSGASVKSSNKCSIISGGGNSIDASVYSSIIGGGNNHIIDSDNSIILGGGASTISGYVCCVIAGAGISADADNTLFARKLSLWDSTVTLHGKTPTVGDVMVVESLDGDYGAVLGWGSGSTNCHGTSGDYATIKECTIGGTSILNAGVTSTYISVDFATSITASNEMAIFANYDVFDYGVADSYSGMFNGESSSNEAIQGNCIYLDTVYDYDITVNTMDINWVGPYASDAAVTSSIQLTTPLKLYVRTAETGTYLNSRIITGVCGSATSVIDTTPDIVGSSYMMGLTTTYTATDALDELHTITILVEYNTNTKKMLVGVFNMYYRCGYINKPSGASCIGVSDKLVINNWPIVYDLPISGDLVNIWDADPTDTDTVHSTYFAWLVVDYVIERTVYTTHAYSNPDPVDCWVMVSGRLPRATLSMNYKMIEVPRNN